MMARETAPYGSWKSPITADLIIQGTVTLDQIHLEGDDIYWLEGRPAEEGRYVIVHSDARGTTTDLLPMPYNARSRAHEYGGGAFTVKNGILYFTNFTDQRLYRFPVSESPIPMTPEEELRYADMVVDPNRESIICVREDHRDSACEAMNTVVCIPTTGVHEGTILAQGYDFYSTPRLSPNGNQLAWLSWNHPNMPWDGCELWLADLNQEGEVTAQKKIAGGEEESIFQPEWSPNGILYFVSDRSGWWNLYRFSEDAIDPICPRQAEFGRPQWVFGMRNYAFVDEEQIACTWYEQGSWHLGLVNTENGELDRALVPSTDFRNIKADPRTIYAITGAPRETSAVTRIDIATQQREVLREAADLRLDPAYLSTGQPIEFPTENGLTAHAIYYPPTNGDYDGPEDDAPPLLVCSHGGPTSAASSTLSLGIQFWTSRGFAVVDVNYGGSTGYGRAYRERLNGNWGIVDVDDCVNAAQYLVQKKQVDGRRLAIRGGSAGGYTTLCALTFREVFTAGASHYGVSDLAALVTDTHKFESRYLDRLIGPYPASKELYHARSPIHFTDRLSCPVILLQGLEDKIVLPNQAESMVDALRAKDLPVAYLPFEGEQHGFRKAENIKRALEGELYFYSRIFGFELGDPVPPIEIENL